ncbi:MAG: class I SAM-dependent methyltransferase [Bacteroidales bacterium]|nr:class I SAM-dependent methyltransferase [Bacteroidales bacterium]MDT8432326.1 class I SAM-dependent methyltransferase [Bacteroidales bacterium]
MFQTDTGGNIKRLPSETRVFLTTLMKQGGPAPDDYLEFTHLVNNLGSESLDDFRAIIADALTENTLIGHAYVKPFGYPGDFTIIRNIYQEHVNPDKRFHNWDRFFQDQAGANAVRNRKQYFLEHCELLEKKNPENPSVLILGSGPATDVHEYLATHPDSRIHFCLIDFDQHAIDFAEQQNSEFGDSVKYFRINVLRYKPTKMFDLIWSAGLFDYFKEKHFAYMINKYYKFLNKDGEFIIGNFSLNNPTKRLMEVLSDWYLNHRSKHDLINVAMEAGIAEENISVDMEALGVNLFLHIRQPG